MYSKIKEKYLKMILFILSIILKSRFKSFKSVPLNSYDTAIVCTPDDQKLNIIKYA